MEAPRFSRAHGRPSEPDHGPRGPTTEERASASNESGSIADAHIRIHWGPVRDQQRASDAPVVTNTRGTAIEPNSFLSHWYDAQRALGIRVRGLYCIKDAFVSTALLVKANDLPWLEQHMGVAYATLRKHYAKLWRARDNAMLSATRIRSYSDRELPHAGALNGAINATARPRRFLSAKGGT